MLSLDDKKLAQKFDFELAYAKALKKIEALKERDDIIAVYLFGSFVTNREKAKDIDFITENMTLGEMIDIAVNFDEPIDVSFMHRMPYYVAIDVFRFIKDKKLIKRRFEITHRQLVFDDVRWWILEKKLEMFWGIERNSFGMMRRVEKVLNEIVDYFNELEEYKNLDLSNKRDFYAVSMILFSIINNALFLGEIFIHQNNLPTPSSYKDMIDVFVDKKVISDELGKKMERLITMENIIAHEYGEITREEIL